MAKMALEKVPIPEQDPKVRARNFEEVTLGYSKAMAMEEAKRCLGCKHKPCVSGCPVGVRIPEFIAKVAEGDFDAAYDIITSTNSLPAVCGRVCPQENQCEGKCVRGIKGEPVAIGRLERFVADYIMEKGVSNTQKPASNGHKVAVIGAGPSGLTCAGDLAKMGYQVTIFEAFHTAGGVLMYGIPEFRLPKSIVQKEIKKLKDLGVEIMQDMVIGKILSVDEIMDMGYEAVFIGSGAGLPRFMGIEGESLIGVCSANEYLTRINLMKGYLDEYDTPVIKSKSVAVVGGGNTAIQDAEFLSDYCSKVYLIHRRDEFRGENSGVKRLKEKENVEFILSATVKELVGESMVEKLLLNDQKTGKDFELHGSGVFVAVGQIPKNETFADTVKLDEGGFVLASEDCLTSHPGIFAAGDCRTKEVRQLTTAAADGPVAALAACKYIADQSL